MSRRLAVVGSLVGATALYWLIGSRVLESGSLPGGRGPAGGPADNPPGAGTAELEPWIGVAILAGLVAVAAAARLARAPDSLHAGLLRRAVALLLDLWVLGLVIVGLASGFTFGLLGLRDLVALDVGTGSMTAALNGGLALLGAGIALVYWTVLHARGRRTVGKYVVDVLVVDADTLEGIRPGRALGRLLAMAVMALLTPLTAGLAGLGFLWPAWDRRRQAAHDKIARTVVVRSGERRRHLAGEAAGQPGSTGQPAVSGPIGRPAAPGQPAAG